MIRPDVFAVVHQREANIFTIIEWHPDTMFFDHNQKPDPRRPTYLFERAKQLGLVSGKPLEYHVMKIEPGTYKDGYGRQVEVLVNRSVRIYHPKSATLYNRSIIAK